MQLAFGDAFLWHVKPAHCICAIIYIEKEAILIRILKGAFSKIPPFQHCVKVYLILWTVTILTCTVMHELRTVFVLSIVLSTCRRALHQPSAREVFHSAHLTGQLGGHSQHTVRMDKINRKLEGKIRPTLSHHVDFWCLIRMAQIRLTWLLSCVLFSNPLNNPRLFIHILEKLSYV